MYVFYSDLASLLKPQGKLVSTHLKLHRVAHRCDLLQGYFSIGCKSHIKQVVT